METETTDDGTRTAPVDTASAMAAEVSSRTGELRAKTKQLMSDSAVVARESMIKRPVSALAMVAAVSFSLGALWHRAR
jgi:hypothetical protein